MDFNGLRRGIEEKQILPNQKLKTNLDNFFLIAFTCLFLIQQIINRQN